MNEGGGLCHVLFCESVGAANDPIFFNILLIFILILINGFFSASEMAVVTMNQARIRSEAEKGDRTAQRLLHFIENQTSFLATIQVCITLAGFLSAAFGADNLAPHVYRLLDPAGSRPWLQTVATILITLIISFFSLVLGELVPKRIGMAKPEAFSRAFAGLLHFCEILFRPVTILLNKATNLVSRLLHLPEHADNERVSEEEIRLLTQVSSRSGEIHEEEADMINKVFDLDDKEVSEIMTPRTAVEALAADSNWTEVLQQAAYGKFSRFPVYDEDIDNIIGILHIKDLFTIYPIDEEKFDLRKVIRPAYFVPSGKTVTVLFREMRQNHISMAVVIDEYGGMDGIISIEDVLEEIVGDISDEYDAADEPCKLLDDGTYLLDGRLTPQEAGAYVPELAEMEEDDDYETMAGFVLSLLGRIPGVEEHPQGRFRNLICTVMEMDDRRVAKIKIAKVSDDTEGSSGHDKRPQKN